MSLFPPGRTSHDRIHTTTLEIYATDAIGESVKLVARDRIDPATAL